MLVSRRQPNLGTGSVRKMMILLWSLSSFQVTESSIQSEQRQQQGGGGLDMVPSQDDDDMMMMMKQKPAKLLQEECHQDDKQGQCQVDFNESDSPVTQQERRHPPHRHPWLVQDVPHPQQDRLVPTAASTDPSKQQSPLDEWWNHACRSPSWQVCDPDGLLLLLGNLDGSSSTIITPADNDDEDSKADTTDEPNNWTSHELYQQLVQVLEQPRKISSQDLNVVVGPDTRSKKSPNSQNQQEEHEAKPEDENDSWVEIQMAIAVVDQVCLVVVVVSRSLAGSRVLGISACLAEILPTVSFRSFLSFSLSDWMRLFVFSACRGGLNVSPQIDLTPFASVQSEEDDLQVSVAAESFAQTLHTQWGVGHQVEALGGGTGILVFLSLSDRAIYISCGGALDSLLTPERLSQVIEDHFKPHLRNHHNHENNNNDHVLAALLATIHALDYCLQEGPPSWLEQAGTTLEDLLAVLIWVTIVTVSIAWSRRRQVAERRSYAQVTQHLNDLDRARAQALQGQYQTTSCPICLEPFANTSSSQQPQYCIPIPSNHSDDQDGSAIQAPGQNSEQESNNEDEPTDSLETALLQEDNDTNPFPSVQVRPVMIGSDGRPVQLLRCGHVFDATCWEEWVASGQGQVHKCPICQQPVGRPPAQEQARNQPPQNRTRGTIVRHQPSGQDQNDTSGSTARESPPQEQGEPAPAQARHQALRQYNFERQFRLARLARRYPQYIGSRQLQQWTQSNYHGSLARDPSFVQRDPSLRDQQQGQQRSNWHSTSGSRPSFRGGGSVFGGGTSGGGRGGRW